jgi:hypothetical protein
VIWFGAAFRSALDAPLRMAGHRLPGALLARADEVIE